MDGDNVKMKYDVFTEEKGRTYRHTQRQFILLLYQINYYEI